MPLVMRLPTTVERLIDSDPSALARLPVLLPGDVVKLCAIHKAMGRSPLTAARAGACAALAAGAHAGAMAVSRMRIETHYRPGGRDEVIIPDKIERPMPLLPFVRHAVDQYLKLRGNPTTGPLFVTMEGDPAGERVLFQGVSQTSQLFGVQGGETYAKLLAFFERQLDWEPDTIAVKYMTGVYTYWEDRQIEIPNKFPEVCDLRDILDKRHALAEPAKTYFGKSATFIEDAPCNLGCRVYRRHLTEAFKTDPMVRELAAVQWPDAGDKAARKKLRKRLKKLYLAHLYSLWKANRLTVIEIAWLFRLSPHAGEMELSLFVRPDAEVIRREPAELRAIVLEQWHARPEGETFGSFNRRIFVEFKLPSLQTAHWYLRAAGLICRPRRGRPRRRRG